MASLLSRALRGAVRGAGRTTGRVLSRHVLPDTVIPSWKTQQRASAITSGIWGFGSGLVKKQARKTALKREAQAKELRAQPKSVNRPTRPASGTAYPRGLPAETSWRKERNERQADISRAKLVELDKQALARTPYRSAALSSVLRPASALRRAATPALPVRYPSTPKKRAYVDTETGEIFSSPGVGRTWVETSTKRNPNSWARGDSMRVRPETPNRQRVKPSLAVHKKHNEQMKRAGGAPRHPGLLGAYRPNEKY